MPPRKSVSPAVKARKKSPPETGLEAELTKYKSALRTAADDIKEAGTKLVQLIERLVAVRELDSDSAERR